MAKELEYGTVNVPAEAFNTKNTKTRISMMIEDDLLLALKEAARSTSHGEYQTLMKEILRGAVIPSDDAWQKVKFKNMTRAEVGMIVEAVMPEVRKEIRRDFRREKSAHRRVSK